MPTGLTYPLTEREMTLCEFAWRCARQFGALVQMRDHGMDAAIPPETNPSNFHSDELRRVRAEIVRLEAMTEEEALAEADAEHEAALKGWREGKNEAEARVSRFQKLLAEVRAWTPPTPEHDNLKNLMIQQLEMDSTLSGYWNEKPKRTGRASWRGAKLTRLRKDLAYHEKHLAEDIERAKGATAWVQALWNQLGPPPQNTKETT